MGNFKPAWTIGADKRECGSQDAVGCYEGSSIKLARVCLSRRHRSVRGEAGEKRSFLDWLNKISREGFGEPEDLSMREAPLSRGPERGTGEPTDDSR